MFVGIAWVSSLTGAVAQRFLSPELERETAAVEQLADHEVDLRVALRAITMRMHALEQRLARQSTR